YQTGYHLGIWSGFSFGLGYEYQIASTIDLVLDAVYFSYGFLGDSERVSLSFRFMPEKIEW
ncbi:MAG: hypothetical protein OEZ20_08315, partial [candidate division WOR-3 bacterium]|nr:hypothetical protein [candidate division WOR-3 bacterium]